MRSEQQNQLKGVSSSSSKSYSSNSSSSSILQPTPRRAATMEEVWKNITYHHHHQPHTHYTHTTHETPTTGMILQDFLAGPPKQTTAASPATPHSTMTQVDSALFPPATILSLNFGLDFVATSSSSRSQADNDDNHHHRHGHQNHPSPSPSPFMGTTPFVDTIGSQEPGIFSFCGKKSLPGQQQMDGSGEGGDRRHKRMIKNRESAARSRARKQAYTNELEVEVKHLSEENERLRSLHDELQLVMAAQPPIRKKLCRTATAPF